MRLIIIVFFTSLVSANSFSCELTDEYKVLAEEATHLATREYKKCAESISEANYWYQLAQCRKSGDGKDIGGGCYHIMGKSLVSLDEKYGTIADIKHCNVFVISEAEIQKQIAGYAEYKEVAKCKKT
ncbi:MAG: hypothetical protein K2W88_14340 [Pararheinheimera sp.]|nr:hypothetical protein [Rheinheimera sp.]